jgi:hypothetical protein
VSCVSANENKTWSQQTEIHEKKIVVVPRAVLSRGRVSRQEQGANDETTTSLVGIEEEAKV